MSLASTYLSRKELIADNLQSMGVVDASGDDGLTTLANKILDIEPSISGLNLDTGITVHSSDDSCLIGQSIMFWAELTAVYDDDTQVDVDLSGVLTGATVVFKSGNTVLGTGVTDNNGIASYTHTFEHTGEYSVTASFAGTENFDSCTSSAINVDVTYKMTITSDKSILSYNNHDVATITATLEDDAAGVSGETLSYEILDKNDNVLDSGSDVTDASGEIEFTYNSLGIGDVTVVVYYGMILQETFVIEDVDYYGDWTKITTDTTNWTQYTGVSGRTIYNWLSAFNEDISMEFKFKNNIPNNWVVGLGMFQGSSNTQIKGIFFNNNGAKQIWWSTVGSANQNEVYSTPISVNSVFKIVTENINTVKFYIDDTLIATKSTRSDYSLYLRIDDFTNTPMELEYLKVKAL